MIHSKYQTEHRRVASALVDRLLFLPFVLIERQLSAGSSTYGLFFSWLGLTAMLHLVYAAWCHHHYGYTFGKWLAGIRVVDLTETRNLSFREGLKRESLYFLIELLVILAFYISILQYSDHHILYDKYRNLSRNVSLSWIFVTILVMLSNPKRRTIPDYFGKSVVIRS